MPFRKVVCSFAFLIASTSLVLAQSNPVPLINNPLVPASVAPGGPSFTLTVNGTGFVSGATVEWNGAPLFTTFISGSRLTGIIPAANIATASTASVTVANPAPGGGLSNVIYFAVTPPRATLSFSETPTSTESENTVVVADFNRDGKLDFATIGNANSASVMLGNGDGTFQAPLSFGVGGTPISTIIAGDFNNDGVVDLAVATQSPYAVAVLLGNGDGTFQPFLSIPTSYWPSSLAVADFNRDGKLDLAIDIGNEAQISVLLGNGDGTFQSPGSQYTLPAGRYVIAGDFNLDGKLDLALTGDSNVVSVLLGNGDGTFQPYQTYATGSGPQDLITADLNGDGVLDLATPDYNTNLGGSVSVLLGNGDGTFKAPQNYTTSGTAAFTLVAGDSNGDGHLDLAVETTPSNSLGLFSTDLLLGNGDGTFQKPLDYAGYAYSAYSLAGGDFNNDGKLDLVTTATISVLLQDSGTVMALSPVQLKFPTQMVGTVSQPQAVQVTNNGTAAVSMGSITTTTNYGKSNDSNAFADLNECSTQLQPGASCSVNVYFTPEQLGSLSGYLAIFDSGGGSPQVVSLSGAGTVVQISPKSLNFGNENVGSSSAQKNIKVTNRGGKTITITSITITGADPGDYAEVNACGSTLGPGASCSIAVIFTPTQTGTRTAAVSISDTGGGSPQKVALIGTGT